MIAIHVEAFDGFFLGLTMPIFPSVGHRPAVSGHLRQPLSSMGTPLSIRQTRAGRQSDALDNNDPDRECPVKDIYAAWTMRDRMSRWLGEVEADIRPGCRYRFASDARGGKTFVYTPEYLVLEPGRGRVGPPTPSYSIASSIMPNSTTCVRMYSNTRGRRIQGAFGLT
jgi:hypothetical protein